jgi:hypothetical protein
VADDRKLEKGLEAILARPDAWPRDAAGACPEAEILAACFERALPEDELRAWEAHASVCARCQEQLAALARAQAAQPAEAPLARPARAWGFNWRWLVPAAATAALALVVSQRISERPEVRIAQVKTQERVAQPETVAPVAAPAPVAAAEDARSKAADRIEYRATLQKAVKEKAEAPAPVAIEEFAVKRAEPAKPPAAEADAPAQAPAKQVVAAAEEQERAVQRAAAESRDAQQIAAARRQQAPAENVAPAKQAPSPAAQALPRQAVRSDETVVGQASGRAVAREGALAKTEPAPLGEKKPFAASATRSDVRTSPVVVVSVKSTVLWRIGVDGRVESSRDAGRTWRPVALPESAFILAASAPEENVCWLAGRGGALYRTTDGKAWEKLPAPSAEDIVAIRATDAQTAQVTLASGRGFETRDAGRGWKALP